MATVTGPKVAAAPDREGPDTIASSVFCDFKPVCGTSVQNRALRKSGDPRLVAFNRLREIP